MVERYVIEINPCELSICTDLYKHLKGKLHCKGLSYNSFYSIITDSAKDGLTKLYMYIIKDKTGYNYMCFYCDKEFLHSQAIVLTVNEFYTRFLQRTMAL